MDTLKVCFTGVGSIAKRHIRNLRAICSERGIKIVIDAFRRTHENLEGIDTIYCSENDVPNDYDVIFITNPTELHLRTLTLFHNKGKHFFIEKPVVSISQIEEAKSFRPRQDSLYYVAAPLRYSSVIQWIKKNINPSEVISIRSISSSYLPDWRPEQDYRETYSAHKNMGGGVSIDLIHEWDYMTYLFGKPKTIFSLIGKKSSLEIDSDDFAIYIAEFEDKIAELHLDYFGRKAIREIQIFTRNDTIIGDLINNKMVFMCSGEEIDFQEKRDDYQKLELSYFLDMVYGTREAEDGYTCGMDVLALTQGNIGLEK